MTELEGPPFPITSARFSGAAFEVTQIPPEHLGEVAFAGRSNVGKSSLINALLLRKKLVRTSNTPGQTQSINFFLINNAFSFVDLPGYGFAKTSKAIQARWKPLIESYLSRRKTLRAVVLIMDCRHPATPHDMQLYGWLREHGLNVILTLTKVDKISRNAWETSRNRCAQVMGVPAHEIVLFSSSRGIGLTALWSRIVNALRLSHIMIGSEERNTV